MALGTCGSRPQTDANGDVPLNDPLGALAWVSVFAWGSPCCPLPSP